MVERMLFVKILMGFRLRMRVKKNIMLEQNKIYKKIKCQLILDKLKINRKFA